MDGVTAGAFAKLLHFCQMATPGKGIVAKVSTEACISVNFE